MRFTIGRIWIKPGQRKEFEQLAADYIKTSRAEDGCVYYDQGPMFDDANGLVLIECWKTAEHHASHTASPHFSAFGPVFEKYLVNATFEEIDSDEINRIVIDPGKTT